MKKLLFCIVLVTLFISGSVNAQSLVPDFKNQPFAVKPDGSGLIKLEKQTAEMKAKAKAMGYGGMSNYINLIPGTSPVVLNGKDLSFTIKVEDDVDPETLFYIARCDAKKKNRQVEIMRTSAFAGYGAGGKSTKQNIIKYDVEKIEDNVYKLNVGNLEAGEYAFISTAQGATGSSSVVFSFGIK